MQNNNEEWREEFEDKFPSHIFMNHGLQEFIDEKIFKVKLQAHQQGKREGLEKARRIVESMLSKKNPFANKTF